MRRRSLICIAAALVVACDSAHQAAPSEETVFMSRQRRQLSPSAAQDQAGFAEVKLGDMPELFTTASPAANSNMVIRTATASVEVDSLEPAVALVQQLAEQVGGYVGGSGIETGRNQLRKAFMEVKVPAARFNEVIGGLKPIGTLESVDVSAQDVGEEFVDVQARMDNARRLEQRLIGLLATRTGKLKDVLDVEQSLAQVREEIERYQGRLRYMEAHAAMSTLSVTLHEPLPVVGTAGKSVMGEAFAQAWRNFVTLLSVLVQSLGVIVPLGLVAVVVWLVTRRLKTASAQRAT